MYEEPNAEERRQQEDDGQNAQWVKDHPEIVIAPENLRECEPEIAEFEKMLEMFESTHPLAELFLIVDLTSEEAPKHPLREPARKALVPIVAKMNVIKNETNIPPEKCEELREKYMKLSRAVGMINHGKVDHTR